jgi:hypothetical protein
MAEKGTVLSLTATRCIDGKQHKFEQLYGGKGGQQCSVCGMVTGAMTDEEYWARFFRQDGRGFHQPL